jgi:hypothetical protein
MITLTMNNLLRAQVRVIFVWPLPEKKDNALATIPRAKIANEMVQRLGWPQVAKQAQCKVFNLINNASIRHGDVMNQNLNSLKRTTPCVWRRWWLEVNMLVHPLGRRHPLDLPSY